MDLKLKEILSQRGITLKDFAAASGISQSNLSNYLNGNISPTLDTLKKMATTLNIELSELFKEKNDVELYYLDKESFNLKCSFNSINVEVFDENLNYITYDDYFSRGYSFNVSVEEGKTYYFVITVPGQNLYDEVGIKFFKEA